MRKRPRGGWSFTKGRLVYRSLVGAAAVGFGLMAYVYVTLPDVRSLATTNPTSTAFMELRAREAESEGREIPHAHQWIEYEQISRNLRRAVLVARGQCILPT